MLGRAGRLGDCGRAGVGKTRLADKCQAAGGGGRSPHRTGGGQPDHRTGPAGRGGRPPGRRAGPPRPRRAGRHGGAVRAGPPGAAPAPPGPPPGDRHRRRVAAGRYITRAGRVSRRAGDDLPDRHRAHRRAGPGPGDRVVAGRPAGADRPGGPQPRSSRYAPAPGAEWPDGGRRGPGVLGSDQRQPPVRARTRAGRPRIRSAGRAVRGVASGGPAAEYQPAARSSRAADRAAFCRSPFRRRAAGPVPAAGARLCRGHHPGRGAGVAGTGRAGDHRR